MTETPKKRQKCSPQGKFITCPICSRSFSSNSIEFHVENCLTKQSPNPTSSSILPATKKPLAQEDNNQPEETAPINESNNFLPLAEKMRPKQLNDIVGQESILGENKTLRGLIENDHIPNMVLYGPPGCGKTTIALLIAQSTKAHFISLSATSSGVAALKQAIEKARGEKKFYRRKTILFIDEIHALKKNQQDVFLPHIENGTVVLIGATTENPSFQVNGALLSRCKVFVLTKLSNQAIEQILKRSIADKVNGIGSLISQNQSNGNIEIEEAALNLLCSFSDGDARICLNCLEMIVNSKISQVKDVNHVKELIIKVDDIKSNFKRTHAQYDRMGDAHYDFISAFHKSIRGSDENAALYWLGRMLEGGENPIYIVRRLIRVASEDIGSADYNALQQATAAFHACNLIGMPECDVILAQCTVYLARAPKSVEIYKAFNNVKNTISEWNGRTPEVPLHLRNAPTKLMKSLKYGEGYKYNPDYDEPVDQTYLPDCMIGENFFEDKYK